MPTLVRDLRYALRGLSRNPGFTAIAIATLALGIGANTAIFSVVHAVALQGLPYQDASRLVRLWEKNDKLRIPQFSASVPNYVSWRERAQSFERWTIARQNVVLNQTICLHDDLPQPAAVDLTQYLPFLRIQ